MTRPHGRCHATTCLHPHHRGPFHQGEACSRAMAAGWPPPATSISAAMTGWYAVRDEAFYERGRDWSTPPRSAPAPHPSGAPVEWVTEPSYFFRLSALAGPSAGVSTKPTPTSSRRVRPAATRSLSFVRGGLPRRPLAISRTSFTWGIPVPDDPAHVMYVWFDALTNYITADRLPRHGRPMLWRFWPADLHLVGKEIAALPLPCSGRPS